MNSLRLLGSDYPVDSAVKEGLENTNCYDDPDETRYILWHYEEHEDWRQQEIEKREKKIIDWAKKAWSDLSD
jgi:hypothetical protein